MIANSDPGLSGGDNSAEDIWTSLVNETRAQRGTYVKGPNGEMVPKEDYDAIMEAYEREQYNKEHPEAKEQEQQLNSHDLEKQKRMKMGWAHMTHWYKEHPEEIDDLIPADSEHDKDYYLEQQVDNPSTIGNLVRDYLGKKDGKEDDGSDKVSSPQPIMATNEAESVASGEPVDVANQTVISSTGEVSPTSDSTTGEALLAPDSDEVEKNNSNVWSIDIVKHSFAKIDYEDLDKKRQELDELRPQIAELYARNRRIIVGKKNRVEFEEIKRRYNDLMDQYIRCKVGEFNDEKSSDLNRRLEEELNKYIADIQVKLTEFADEEADGHHRTQEEIDSENKRLLEEATKNAQAWYDEEYNKAKTNINTEFLEELVQQKTILAKETSNAIDNGTTCRKFISKVINNRVLKKVLTAACVAGLVATGVGVVSGLTAGTLAVSVGYTGAGVATNAAKGAALGFLMSRRDSKASRVKNFANREAIAREIENLDLTNESVDTKNVADWFMDRYAAAGKQDRRDSIIGGVKGSVKGGVATGVVSGIHFNTPTVSTTETTGITDYTPVEYGPQYGIADIDVPRGGGLYKVFEQLNIDPSKWGDCHKIAEQVAPKYGIVADVSKGLVSHAGGPEIMPGNPSTWNDVSQQYIRDVIDGLYTSGFIPKVRIGGGEPIYGIISETTTTMVKNSIMSYLRDGAATALAAVTGRIIGSARERMPGPEEGNFSPAAERKEVEGFASVYNDMTSENMSEDVKKWSIIASLAKNLSYPGAFSPGDNIEASFTALPDEMKARLETLYDQVVAEATNRRSGGGLGLAA